VPPAEIQRPAIPPDEFQAAIAAELNKTFSLSSGPGAVPYSEGSADTHTVSSSPGPTFDPAALTLDAMAAALHLPFYILAWVLQLFRVAPDPGPILAVGAKHAPTLAKAVYPIYDHYARQYIGEHPDQVVNVSIHVAILDAVGIVPDMIDAVNESRAKAAARQQQQAGPPPGANGVAA
jgi:hypothetical protein